MPDPDYAALVARQREFSSPGVTLSGMEVDTYRDEVLAVGAAAGRSSLAERPRV